MATKKKSLMVTKGVVGSAMGRCSWKGSHGSLC